VRADAFAISEILRLLERSDRIAQLIEHQLQRAFIARRVEVALRRLARGEERRGREVEHEVEARREGVRGEMARDEAALRDTAEPQADDADIDMDGLRFEPFVFRGPIVPLDGFAEPFSDRVRLRALGQIGNQKAELVAAEPRVQILRLRGAEHRPFLREQVVGSHLLAEQMRHALDNPVADGVPGRSASSR